MEPAPPRFCCGPDLRFTIAAGLGALLFAGIALAGTDPAGRFLSGAAALLLTIYFGTDMVFRPRLCLDVDGIRVRSPGTSAHLPWTGTEVRVDDRTRLGLRSRTLEIDGDAVLIVLSRRALGAEPQAVAELAHDLRAYAQHQRGGSS